MKGKNIKLLASCKNFYSHHMSQFKYNNNYISCSYIIQFVFILHKNINFRFNIGHGL